ncbi:MAG: RNA polymerase sigma factor, partial [Acidobacteria bacterium]|nr:RNA polymerase sigma factor [Acidobacteriota bacterium]
MVSDSELWRQILGGNADAFETFYRENASRLRAFLEHTVGNRETAEDLMQETFTQIWRHPNGFQQERGSLRAYVYGIARKRAADWWRTRQRRAREVEASPALERGEVLSILDDALGRLS